MHPAWAGNYLGGTPGYGEPDLADAQVLSLDAENAEMLRRLGIELVGQAGSDCLVCIAGQPGPMNLQIRLHGHHRSRLLLGRCKSLFGAINLEGSDHLLIVAGTPHALGINATFRSDAGAILVGREASANHVDLLAEGHSIQIGDDALISYGVHVFTSDSHCVIDLSKSSPERINPPASVVVGPHVWLGANSLVLKGVSVGQGAIVAATTVVTSDVPERSVVTGAPAKVLRREVTWARELWPNEAELQKALASAGHGSSGDVALPLAAPPTAPSFAIADQTAEPSSNAVGTIVRLGAPDESSFGGDQWHQVETVDGTRFRWTRSERVVWHAADFTGQTGAFRFEILYLGEIQQGYANQSVLQIGNTRYPLSFENNVLTATVVLDHDFDGAVALLLPRPVSTLELGIGEDTRQMGLSILVG